VQAGSPTCSSGANRAARAGACPGLLRGSRPSFARQSTQSRRAWMTTKGLVSVITRTSYYESSTMSGTGYNILIVLSE
jgi:hypothetical protein